jgi:hypothetical protein
MLENKNDRVELEMKIMKYRQAAMLATSNDETRQRIMTLVAELEPAGWKRGGQRRIFRL